MIADIVITEKSFGPKSLMSGVKFSIDDGEKVGVVGRNGVGKSTLFGILAGTDKDFTGEVIYRRGVTVVATAQEHHGNGEQTVMDYVLAGLPEYPELHHIITTYPETMGDDMRKIEEYSAALDRFGQKGFYQVEELVAEELKNFQLEGFGDRQLSTLSGGQKRLVEVVKIMHSDADLALVDEPTNHMDYVAKDQFIDWMKGAREAMLVITHDRDVLQQVDRIIELKDGGSVSYRGNYDAYLKQNAERTSVGMNDFEMIEKRMVNLKQKVLDYQRLKEKSRNPGTIQKFKRLENESREEYAELEKVEKPTFWIDKDSVGALDYRAAGRYEKFKTKNIRMSLKNDESRSKHVLVSARELSLGYDTPLFEGVNIDLREGEAVELRGRNGAGKSTLIKALLSPRRLFGTTPSSGRVSGNAEDGVSPSEGESLASPLLSATRLSPIVIYGELKLDPQVRVGVYEQEVSPQYFDLPLKMAIERVYMDNDLTVNETKIRQLMSDYLFTESDGQVPVARLSGGQKARLQIIAMLANDPQLLILDEPTNHLDLPSIEELETALEKYSGAILYVSHDNYFREKIGGEVVQIGR
ncbi:MAG: ATP-binding cassette domain-containing protein [Candidatus Saccharimonas sp.]